MSKRGGNGRSARLADAQVVVELNRRGGRPQCDIAHELQSQAIPFILMTGYDPDALPKALEEVVRL